MIPDAFTLRFPSVWISILPPSTLTPNPVLFSKPLFVCNCTALPLTLSLVVIVLNLESTILPANIVLVTPPDLTLIMSLLISRLLPSTLTLIVLPVCERPEPAVILPAPVNCVNTNAVVPNVILPSVVNANPLSAFVVPSSTKVNAPEVTSVLSSKSVALVGAPDALTV